MTDVRYVARRRFGPQAGDRWRRYLIWSRLSQLQELVTLDTMLCPPLPEELAPEDWNHNVHADYETLHFRSFEYLRRRVAHLPEINLLAIIREPTTADLRAVRLPGFTFLGVDLLDVHGDVSALSNCGGFDEVFRPEELNPHGLLDDRARAAAVRRGLRAIYPNEHHAVCDVWALWRWTLAEDPPARPLATAESPSRARRPAGR